MLRRLAVLLFAALGPALSGAVPPLAERTAEGFPVPKVGWRPKFPRANAAHPEFRIEWWYITGHLFGEDGARHGFQVTFFRNAHPQAPGELDAPGTTFGLRQLHLAHMALTDTKTGKFLHQERLNRAGWDADASTERLHVRNGGWSLTEIASDAQGRPRFKLLGGVHADARLELEFTALKAPVVFGEDGVSRKGAGTTAASHYITHTRLGIQGTLALGEAPGNPVTGTAWFDHEISSSQLDDGQTGWDWASLQLDDGREVMAYILRGKDGSIDGCSTLAWVGRDGTVTHHGPAAFRWEPLDWWTSPATGGRYPISVRITAPDPEAGDKPVVFTLRPFVRNQELRGAVGGVPYWEGACQVLDPSGAAVGSAYLELTGYAQDLGRVLGSGER